MNVLPNVHKTYPIDLVDRSVTKYALFDFGHSKQYPLDCDIEGVEETRFFNFDLRGMVKPQGAYNPFQVEMYSVGLVLQRHVRVSTNEERNISRSHVSFQQHIENIVPELGPFFDAMLDDIPSKRLTARDALNELNKIYKSLSKAQLNSKVTMLFWHRGW